MPQCTRRRELAGGRCRSTPKSLVGSVSPSFTLAAPFTSKVNGTGSGAHIDRGSTEARSSRLGAFSTSPQAQPKEDAFATLAIRLRMLSIACWCASVIVMTSATTHTRRPDFSVMRPTSPMTLLTVRPGASGSPVAWHLDGRGSGYYVGIHRVAADEHGADTEDFEQVGYACDVEALPTVEAIGELVHQALAWARFLRD